MEWATVNIDLNKLIDICSNGRKSREELLKTFNIMNDKNIHEVFRYRKFNDGFSDKVTCYNDGSEVIGVVRPSYVEFLTKLFTILNVNPKLRYLIGKDDQDLEDVLKARIEVLKYVQNEADLQNEFPILYKDLQDGRKYINDIRKRRRELAKDTTMTEEEKFKEKEILDKKEKQFYRSALSPAFDANKKRDSFIHKQVEFYTRLVEGRKDYKELLEKTDYNKYVENNFDTDKMALYVVDGYLRAIDATEDRDVQLKYYNLVENYLNSSKTNKDVEIIVDGVTINYNNIYKRAKIAYSKLTRIDIVLNVEFLPTGSGYDVVNSSDTKKRRIPMSLEREEKLKSIGREINKYYLNTSYSAKVIGLKKFAGYFAYIYDNGIVVLDKDFREKYPTTAEGAIYIMEAKDFELLCGIGKTNLIYNPLLLAHLYHRGDWTTKVDEYINREATEERKEESIQLKKRLEKENKKNI